LSQAGCGTVTNSGGTQMPRKTIPHPAKARVVLVEDHPIVREGLVQLVNGDPKLTVCGEAATVADALRVVQETAPDIVVTDITLAGGNGIDFIKDLRARWPDIPALVLSVHDERIYAERVLRAGGRGYIMKTEHSSRIREAIQRVLSGCVYLSDAMTQRLLQGVAGRALHRDGSLTVACLSDRELQVFELAGHGFGTTDVAQRLNLSAKTVETYYAGIKRKLGLGDAGELRRRAIEWVQGQSQA
jgi:DNA-binding NarL/FixJ family response regulator